MCIEKIIYIFGIKGIVLIFINILSIKYLFATNLFEFGSNLMSIHALKDISVLLGIQKN